MMDSEFFFLLLIINKYSNIYSINYLLYRIFGPKVKRIICKINIAELSYFTRGVVRKMKREVIIYRTVPTMRSYNYIRI